MSEWLEYTLGVMIVALPDILIEEPGLVWRLPRASWRPMGAKFGRSNAPVAIRSSR